MPTLEEVGVGVGRYIPRPGEVYFEFAGGSVVLDQVCRCLVKVVNERGIPLPGIAVTNFWPGGGTTLVTDADGKVEFFFGPEAKFWKPSVGPHSVRVTDASDVISGMGLPEGHHADYQLLFVRKVAGTVTPPSEPPSQPPSEPPSEPPAGSVKVRGTLRIFGIPVPFELLAEVEK